MSMLPASRYDFPGPRISRSGPNRNIAVFATIASILFLAGVYFAWPYLTSSIGASPHPASFPAQQAVSPAVADGQVDDFIVHQQNLQRLIAGIQEKERRQLTILKRITPALQHDYLKLDLNRMQTATEISESKLQDYARLLEELEMATRAITNHQTQSERKNHEKNERN